nr:hypothetical protein Iba_chr03bCG3760 [Ipomoea batatas]
MQTCKTKNAKVKLIRLARLPRRVSPGLAVALRRWPGAWSRPQLRRRPGSRCGLRRWSSRNLDDGDWQVAPLRDRGERGWTGIRHFLRKNGQNVRQVGLVHRHLQSGLDVVLHRPSPAVKGPSVELIHQVFPDRSSGDSSRNRFSGLLASADVTGEQDGIGEDLLSQICALQDPSPGLLGRLELALELLDPLVPLGKGLLKGRHLSMVDFVPVFGPGKEIGDGVGHLQDYKSQAMRSPTNTVDHPLVFSRGGAAAQILDSRAAGGSSPCFISTSITGVVDPDPSRRVRFAGATSSTSASFSFPCLAARVSPWSPLRLEGCVAVKGSPAGTRASALGSVGFAGPDFLDPRLIFFAGAGGRAETGKLLIAPENQKHKRLTPSYRVPDLRSPTSTNLVNQSPGAEARRLPSPPPSEACTSAVGRIWGAPSSPSGTPQEIGTFTAASSRERLFLGRLTLLLLMEQKVLVKKQPKPKPNTALTEAIRTESKQADILGREISHKQNPTPALK